MRIKFLMNPYDWDLGGIRHFPPATRVGLDPNIVTDSLISNPIIDHIIQVENKRFQASIPAKRPRVERKSSIIRPPDPIQKGSRRHLHVPGQDNAPDYLNRIAPRNGYSPIPASVVAYGLLHEPIRVQSHGPNKPLQGLQTAGVWEYGLNDVQVVHGN